MSGWSETRLHAWLARQERPAGLVGSPMDDAAVLRAGGGRPVLCSDQVIEGVHFVPGTPAARVGRKAAARVLSDLAATAAEPRALLCDLAAPAERDERELRALLGGLRSEARRHGADLVGGDLAARPGALSVSVAGYGVLPGARRAPGRDRARPGQVLLLTGPVGGSGLGRHLAIEPRLAAGRVLFAAGATALMDVSDGLARDLDRLARASGVALRLADVPVHPDARRAARRSGRPAREHALHDGEDHELIATLPRAVWERRAAALRRAVPGLVEVGTVTRGAGLWFPRDSGWVRWDGHGGWVHGDGHGS